MVRMQSQLTNSAGKKIFLSLNYRFNLLVTLYIYNHSSKIYSREKINPKLNGYFIFSGPRLINIRHVYHKSIVLNPPCNFTS